MPQFRSLPITLHSPKFYLPGASGAQSCLCHIHGNARHTKEHALAGPVYRARNPAMQAQGLDNDLHACQGGSFWSIALLHQIHAPPDWQGGGQSPLLSIMDILGDRRQQRLAFLKVTAYGSVAVHHLV